MQNYTVLHCHTMLSNGVTNIDSITTYKDYINKAKECGMNALAFSEHGSVFGWYNKKMEVEKAGMKYIHAQEFYITETLDEKVRDNFHCLLLARGYDGFIELNKLSSKAFNRQSNNFYYVPRISFEDLINTSDEIIISTGCLAGILNKGSEELQKRMLEFMLANKHRCFLELQPHISEDQKAYNRKLYELSVEHGLEMVMCTDTHALNDEHVEGRLVLQKSKNIHFEGEDEFDLTFKTYEELIRACKLQAAIPMEAYYDAIENTNKIADMVEEFDIDYSYKYPHLWGDDSGKVFKRKIMEGIKRKGIDKYPNYNEYVERIRHEIESYVHNDAIDFMLLMEDIVNWCNKHDINIGYGRGSVNGSVIAWLLGITEMDSIKHGLNFERFMNVERQSLADIDSDIPPSKIEEVKQYLFNKHGLYCSDIITFNTIALKGAIRDVGRALEMPLKEVDEISKSVDNKEAQLREKYPELFKYVDMVEGTIISVGSHPCGTVVNAFPLDGPMGLMTTSTSKYPISQIYMKEIDAQNYVKLDLLKLDTIELINETCKLAGIERVTPDLLDVTDETVWNEMRDDTTQVFQWESDLAQSYVRKLLSDENIERFKEVNEDVDRMTLLTIGNSAIRPAGASYRDDLAKGVIRKTGYKCLDDFLKPTFGYLVFQCQIIEFLHEYCGFTMGEADLVRRHFAKKMGTEKDIPIIKYGGKLNDAHHIPGFIETMKDKYGLTESESEAAITDFLQVIEDASNYLFSINHSQPYSYEGYAAAWLRHYYPLEFLTTALNINEGKQEKTNKIIEYANKVGIKIEGIKFRHSLAEYTFSKEYNSIYKGMSSIKYLNKKISRELYALRDNKYEDFIDLLIDIKKTSVNSRQLEILIKLDFFSEFGHIKKLLTQVKIFDMFDGRKTLKVEEANRMGLTPELIEKFGGQSTEKQIKNLDIKSLIKYICDNRTYPKTTITDRINYENETLGYIDIKMPELSADYGYVLNVNKKYNNKMIELYRLQDGTTESIKVKGKTYDLNPIEEGMIIRTLEASEELKWYKAPDGSWKRREDEYETILRRWKIVR